jgi:hypothetical protein
MEKLTLVDKWEEKEFWFERLGLDFKRAEELQKASVDDMVDAVHEIIMQEEKEANAGRKERNGIDAEQFVVVASKYAETPLELVFLSMVGFKLYTKGAREYIEMKKRQRARKSPMDSILEAIARDLRNGKEHGGGKIIRTAEGDVEVELISDINNLPPEVREALDQFLSQVGKKKEGDPDDGTKN